MMQVQEDYQGQERRRAERVPICMPVAAECDAWATLCHVKDISLTGIFLISQQLPSPSTGFMLKVRLPAGLGTLRVGATVTRIQGETPRGMALIFRDQDERAKKMILDLVQRWGRAFGSVQA